MAGYLTLRDGLGQIRKIELTKPVFTLGRQADNDLQLLGPSVSRRHADIVREGGDFYLVDRESTTGSFVNEERIERHQLRHGDRIRLGAGREHEIEFLDSSSVAQVDSQVRSSASLSPQSINARAELRNLARFLEVNQALKISLPIDEVLRLIVDASVEITKADRGALLLREDGGKLTFRVGRDKGRQTLSEPEFPMSRTALDQVYKGGRSLILAGGADGARAMGSESVMGLDLRTIVCIPLIRFQMMERGESTGMHVREIVGVLYVDSRQAVTGLTRASVTLLESLAFEASKALESVRLIQQEEEKRKIEKELATAREVQNALLSTTRVESDQAEITGSSIPCRYVGGDFFDMFPMEGGRVAAVLGDVSGKGISAGLLAAMAQGVLHTQLGYGLNLGVAFTQLNKLLVAKSPLWRFITLFCGVLELGGRFAYLNGGHNPPMLLRTTGELEYLSSDSMVLGVWGPAVYNEAETKLLPGDVLVSYTDGVTEATGPSGEMFGEARLQACVREVAALQAAQIRDRLLERVAEFTRHAPQEDDITVVVLKMKS